MVYCELIEHSSQTALYRYGALPEKLTGIIKINTDGDLEIIKEATGDIVYYRSLVKLSGKYRNEFAKGVFRKHLSFES